MKTNNNNLTKIQLDEIKDFFSFISMPTVTKELNALFKSYLVEPDRVKFDDKAQHARDNVNVFYTVERIIQLLQVLEPKD